MFSPKQNNQVSEMQRKMKDLVKNNDKYNAYIFVFDLSEKDTFEELLQIIKLVTMNERSQQKSKRNTGAAAETLKIVVGNKKDLK